MNSFHERVIKPGEEAAERIAELGGLPEITSAASGLRDAIDRTRTEIENADFASRFLPTAGRLEEALGQEMLSLTTRLAVEADGERGLKREQLRTDLRGVESELLHAIYHLVELRADLAISQLEF